MKLALGLFLSIVVGPTAFAQTSPQASAPSLVGQWRLVGANLGGQVVPPAQVMKVTLTFESGGRFRDTEGAEARWVVDASASPNHLDLSHTAGRDAGKQQRPVFEVVGDRLTIVYSVKADERPASLTGNPNVAIFVFERITPTLVPQ